MLVKFVRRGQRTYTIKETFPLITASFSKKESISIMMESPIYLSMKKEERILTIKRLSGELK